MTREQDLRDLCAGVKTAEQRLKDARAERDKAIASAAHQGTRVNELVDITGLTREQVRRIVRAREAADAAE